MEYYSPVHTQQLAPLIALALGTGNVATLLRKHFDDANIGSRYWDNVIIKNRLLNAKYILRYVDSEAAAAKAILVHKRLHSGGHNELSPFNAQSDLFPNGILSTRWFRKYAEDFPFAVVAVYELGDDASRDEVLGASLASLRAKYHDLGVRFLAIITSSATNVDADAERTALLRQSSGLPRLSGLFYLNSNPETLERDCGVLASSIFSTLRASATDFYSLIEHRVKQRYKKYYTLPLTKVDTAVALTPKFLEVRCLIKQAMLSQLIHPHNVESSLSTLEQSYESLTGLLRELNLTFLLPTVSLHDLELYLQWRTLLDVIAIHLIRGYFSIEEPVAALRKHEAHIASVSDLISDKPTSEQQVWKSVQYQWLADLMRAIPPSILKDLHSIQKTKNKSNANSVAYFGGITFHDTFYGKVVTTIPLIYAKAATQLTDVEYASSPTNFPVVFDSTSAIRNHKIELLKAAKLYEEEGTKREGYNDLYDWQIAEEYMLEKNYEQAIEHYRSISTKGKLLWGAIANVVNQRILEATRQLGSTNQLLQQLARLSISSESGSKLPDLSSLFANEKSLKVQLDGDFQLLNIQLAITNENASLECHAYDAIISQLDIISKFDNLRFQQAYPGADVSLVLEQLLIKQGERTINVAGLGNDELLIQTSTVTDLTVNFNFSKLEEGLKLRVREVVVEPGIYEITEITAQLKIIIAKGDSTIELVQLEKHEFDSTKLQYSVNVFSQGPDHALVPKVLRMEGTSSTRLYLKPYRPEIGVKLTFPFASAIVGEKFDLSFTLSFAKPPIEKFSFKAVNIEVKTRVLEDGIETEDLRVQENWESLKDDESLDILDFVSSSDETCKKTLQVGISRPPSVTALKRRNLSVLFAINLVVIEASGEVSIYELDSYTLPVMAEPFGTELAVFPRAREDGTLPMPNPFVIGALLEDSNNFSMPLPSRTWAAKVTTNDVLQLLQSGLIEITQVQISMKSKNPEVAVDSESAVVRRDQLYEQLFLTSSKYRFAYRNVKVVTSAVFNWKRKDGAVENTYETEEWEITLPLQDPRVLLLLVREEAKVELKYTIENPTPRILTFATTMSTESAAMKGINWGLDDVVNIVPLKQSAFPVLPFSQHTMRFTGKYHMEEASDKVELPHFQVYDVNYKVNLPTLSLEEDIEATESALIMKI